ncbi:GDSL-type esterase/lipase family protein [Carnobacteriaceae bacterium 52-44]
MKSKSFKRSIFTLFLLMILTACGTGRLGGASDEVTIEEGDIKVAAVGDSITAEYTPQSGYPAILNERLGEGYAVLNFGESNYAAQASSDFPYETTGSYEESLELNPDIVIMMLGTNDTKANNWNGPERFKEEYTDLLEDYLELESVSRVILASPPTVFLENIFEGSIDPENIEPIRDVVEEVAEEYGLEFLDMTEQTAAHPDWFFDGVHPTAEGAEQLAQIFYEQIEE